MAYSFANAQKHFQGVQQATQAAKGFVPPQPAAATPSATPTAPAAQGFIPPMNAAMAGNAASPAMGYGGAQYGASGGVNRALEANQARLGSDDAFKQSEIARTQQVIAQRQAAGQDVSAQNKYLTQNLGWMPPQTTPIQSTPVQQPVQPTFGANDMSQPRSAQSLWQQSGDMNTIERADRQNAADTATGSLKNNFDYASQLLKDNRVLEDASFSENNSPFSGATEYRKAMLQRGRGIDDNYRSQELNNQLNAISTDMYNFDKLAPERQRQIYNQMLQMERDFGISVAQLMGVFGGQRTMAGAQQDWGQQMDLANLTGNLPNPGNVDSAYGAGYGANGLGLQTLAGMSGARTLQGQQMDLQNKQANMDVAFGYMDRFGQLVNPQEDWSGPGRQIAAGGGPQTLQGQNQQFNQDMQSRQYDEDVRRFNQGFEYTQGRDTVKDQQWTQEFNRILSQDGVQNALAWANHSISQQNANTSSDNSLRQWAEMGMQGNEQSKYAGMPPNQVMSNIKSNYMEPIVTTDQFGKQTTTGERVTTDANKRYQMFLDVINSNLESDTVEDQVLLGLGMSKDEISKMEARAKKEYGGGN